eukprot:747354-Ditylum_brightwellii.AAC.1
MKDTKYVSQNVPDYYPKTQVGKGKDFASKAEFYAWKQIPPKDGNIYCLSNGLRWPWCTKCKSWGSHEVTNCRCALNHGSQSSSKQDYLTSKLANKGDQVDVDSVVLSTSGIDSDCTSAASNSVFLGSKNINK